MVDCGCCVCGRLCSVVFGCVWLLLFLLECYWLFLRVVGLVSCCLCLRFVCLLIADCRFFLMLCVLLLMVDYVCVCVCCVLFSGVCV